ncbi:MAG: transporter substrate-binding domain-containing protein [Oscillospiraceae bacterium]|nr:transporter substrate-binding domain-containing protein [Oscillospiraceae bacterium]
MKRMCMILLVLVMMVPLFSMDARAAHKTETLRIAYEQDDPYYAYSNGNGESVGLHVDILKAIAAEMDIAMIEYHPKCSIRECILALENGEVDAVLGFPMLYDGDTSNVMISSEINTIDLCMMASQETATAILSGERESYTAVFEHNINNYQIVSNLGARLYFVVDTQAELVDSVLEGKAQVMVCDENCVAAILNERELGDDFQVIRSNITTVGYAIAVRKGADSLLRAINDGLIRIRMSGQYEQILRRWSKGTVDPEVLIRNVMLIAGAAFVVVLVYFCFSWRLRKILKLKITEVRGELANRMQQLQYESHLRNQIIEYAPSMMILCDIQEKTILMNAAARKLTGFADGEGSGLPVQTIPVVGDLVKLALRQAGLEQMGQIENILVGYRQEKGEKRSYQCTIIEARISNLGSGFLLIIADVTEAETKKQELIEKEKSVALSRLVAGIAHEIKNPLTGIQNFADLIITERDNPEFWGYFAEYVPKEINRISKLIESLMHYARPAKGVKTPTEAAQLVRESMYLLNTAASSAAIRVNVELEDGLMIFVERDRIKQVLINVLLNSLEAVETRLKQEGRERIYGIMVSVFRQQGHVLIRVEDQGNGMDEEELQSCMDPFYTTKEKGTGLGLAISRQFVQENGGTMTIDSIPGEGTSIVLRFKEMDYE